MSGSIKVNLDDIHFGPDGLVPVVVQDTQTGAVLMQAYADRAAIEHALTTRRGTYFSRSRSQQWIKGLTSGHVQHIESIHLDCDGDSVLYRVQQSGPACHTGEYSCFYRPLLPQTDQTLDSEVVNPEALTQQSLGDTLERVYTTITERLRTLPEQSYVARLHAGGLDRVLKKISEEAGEVLLAAKNGDKAELATETADLLFHTFFALAEVGVTPGDVARVLEEREGKSGLKGPKEIG
ncbi:bifunctional phosphoribosyl-AMP cyclohydrolase/phosphoribosyl-ATP diphosphatase HisIE [Deinococcus psychrotolerans]|uniref:Histidine biosynthesis bifunctional protein HisIE n=1 Tax=Deinococcus psychrotolerans TaxID=2489213 RepID=A0A3G8YR25_9DEIO|nr:bifunctional phosphoribosyl-AMP cyclohydrolase/phosphoribosyl-ATP diphosphatase HisIE [Deinococcus psychrotolerans]AZI43676.1 bifunctional phosphoribosyl-AMP cyclohydrolase/phosphoribosyl-ATP diphosphatase HisIE [Deinococcus psychrotolerans]